MAQHFDEVAGNRQVGPGRFGADMEEHDRPALHLLFMVTSGVPSARLAHVRSARSGVGSASTWRLTGTSVGRGMPAKGLKLGNPASGLRFAPGQAAAKRTFRPGAGSTGTSGSSAGAAARRGSAKRSSMPPFEIQRCRGA